MQFTELELPGLYLVDLDWIGDERGGFAKVFSRDQLTEAGLYFDVVDHNFSFSRTPGTIRGLHYQVAPHAEIKLIRCVRGALVDAVVDMRPDSPTFGQGRLTELDSTTHQMLYVPGGFAHGFQTLEPNTYAEYYASAGWAPEAERGVRWNDPSVGLDWPLDPRDTLSAKDQAWPDIDFAELSAVAAEIA